MQVWTTGTEGNVGRHGSPEALHLKLPEWVHTARQPHAARCGRLDPTRGEDLRVFWGSLQLAGAADGLFLAGTDGLFRR